MNEHDKLHMLLVEPETLLRRTVSLTARTLGLGSVHEASSIAAAQRMLREHTFHGAVIAIDCESCADRPYNLALLDQVRDGLSVSERDMPIAVMAEHATTAMLRDLRLRHVSRVIVKPFRAKVLLETFASFETAHKPPP